MKSVLKSLKFPDKPAEDLGDDLKAVGRVAKTLEKAFPGEFAPTFVASTFGELTDQALDALEEDLDALQASIESGMGSLPAKVQAKVQKFLDKADAARDASHLATSRFARAKALGAVWNLLSKAKKILDTAGGGPGTEGVTASIEGTPWTAASWQASQASGSGSFLILATEGEYPAARSDIFITYEGLFGTGEYDLAGSGSDLKVYAAETTQADVHTVEVGNLTVTVFDPPNRIAGTFSFTTGADPGVVIVTNGKFDIHAPEFSVSE